jgi:hypothetical protein
VSIAIAKKIGMQIFLERSYFYINYPNSIGIFSKLP